VKHRADPDLFDPLELARLGRLDLIARRVLEGFLTGKHRSAHKGSNVEFAEHRLYTPGDELRLVDWRVLGRRDRYYIRQFEQENNLQAWLVLDTSGSMEFGVSTITKLHYARMVAAALARLLLNQRDAVGLVCADRTIRTYVPPRAAPSHFKVISDALEQARPAGRTSLAAALQELAGRIRRRGLIVILSDCFDDVEALCKAMHQLHARGHELLLFHVMAPEERTFEVDGWSLFESLEDAGEILEVDPAAAREAYLCELDAFIRRLRHGCGEIQCDYVPLSTDDSPIEALARYLAWRSARMKR